MGKEKEEKKLKICISARGIQLLAGLLEQVDDDLFLEHLKECRRALIEDVPDVFRGEPTIRFFHRWWQKIVRCETCGGAGYNKHDNPPRYDEPTIDKCEKCGGDGSRVKRIFVRYEKLDDNLRKRFAT